jgi:hypothetical protein
MLFGHTPLTFKEGQGRNESEATGKLIGEQEGEDAKSDGVQRRAQGEG